MNPETGKAVLIAYFDAAKRAVEANLTPEKLKRLTEGKLWTDLQARMFFPFEERGVPPKPYYCLNFALITADEEVRRQAMLLLRIIDEAFGRGEGVRNVEKKVRAYLGGKAV